MKRLRSIVVVMFMFLMVAVPVFAIDGVLSGVISSDEGANKDIYGSYIVWKANDGTIKLHNLKDGQTTVIGQGNYPRIYRDSVVWVDTIGQSVVKYDVKTGTTTTIGSSYGVGRPWIHGTKIVWSKLYEGIQVYDIFSGQTTTLSVMGDYPVVYENMLTYIDYQDVHLYDMVRGTDTIVGIKNGMVKYALIDDNYIYWEGYDGDYTINRYSISDNIVLTPVPVCGSPFAMAVSNGKVFFDGNCDGPEYWRVRQFDPKTGSISVLTAPIGTQPYAPAVYGNKVVLSYWPDGLRTFDITSPREETYSLNATANTVTVINPYKTDDPTTTGIDERVVATIATGAGPSDSALSPDETKLYILNSTAKTVTVAQTYDFVPVNTVNINPTNKQTATAVAGDNDSNTYVALKSSTGAGVVKKITSAGIETTLTVGVNPNGLKISPDNKKLLVSNSSSSNLTAIDLATFTIIEGNITTGAGPKLVKP